MSGGGTAVVDPVDPTLHRVVAAYFASVNAGCYADAAALFTPDAVLSAPGVTPRRGRAQIADYLETALRHYPTHTDHPGRVLVSGASATVEIRFVGATAGGAVTEFDALDLFDFDERGAITRLSSWYDSAAVRGRLRDLATPSATPPDHSGEPS